MRYRKIDPRIWNDRKFRRLSDDGKLAFLFILTHPSMTALGAMRATVEGLAAELGWRPERLLDAISDAISDGLLVVNRDACFVGAQNFLKYNEPEGPNSVTKAWIEALDLVPECSDKVHLVRRCRVYLDGRSDAFRHAMPDAIWDAFGDASPIQEQEQEQEQEKPAPGGAEDGKPFELSAPAPSTPPRAARPANEAPRNARIAKKKSGPPQYTADFERLYALYPRKEGKADGFEHYLQQIKGPAERDLLEAAICTYAKLVANRDKDRIKHFDSFMSKGRWCDYVPSGTGSAPAGQPNPIAAFNASLREREEHFMRGEGAL